MTIYCAKCGCIVGYVSGKVKRGTVHYCIVCDPRNVKIDLPEGFAEIFGLWKKQN